MSAEWRIVSVCICVCVSLSGAEDVKGVLGRAIGEESKFLFGGVRGRLCTHFTCAHVDRESRDCSVDLFEGRSVWGA